MSDGSTETDSHPLYPFTLLPYFFRHHHNLPRLPETLNYMKTSIPAIAWHGSQHSKTNLGSSAQNSDILSTELYCLHALRVLRVWPYVFKVSKNHCLTWIKIFSVFRCSLFPLRGTRVKPHKLFLWKKAFYEKSFELEPFSFGQKLSKLLTCCHFVCLREWHWLRKPNKCLGTKCKNISEKLAEFNCWCKRVWDCWTQLSCSSLWEL